MSTATNTQIAELVDITAAIALEEISGIKSGAGWGTGLVDHPRAGTGNIPADAKIPAAGANPLEPFTHWSNPPEAGSITLQSMRGTHVMSWTIPMLLFIGRGIGIDEAKRLGAPFMALYLAAFAKNLLLRGKAQQIASITFRWVSDDDWIWLETRLAITERLNLATRA